MLLLVSYFIITVTIKGTFISKAIPFWIMYLDFMKLDISFWVLQLLSSQDVSAPNLLLQYWIE